MRGSLAGDLPLTGLEAPSPFGCVHLSPCTTYSRVAVNVAVIAHFGARPATTNWAPTRVGPVGIEPTTRGLKVRCSTTELQARARLPASQTILAASRPAAGRAAPGPDNGSSTARRPRRRRRSGGRAGRFSRVLVVADVLVDPDLHVLDLREVGGEEDRVQALGALGVVVPQQLQ